MVMDACLAVVFVEYIHTDEFCHYVGEGKEPSGNVKLLGKRHVDHHRTSRGWAKVQERKVLLTRAVHLH